MFPNLFSLQDWIESWNEFIINCLSNIKTLYNKFKCVFVVFY